VFSKKDNKPFVMLTKKSSVTSRPHPKPKNHRLKQIRHFLRYLIIGGINTLFGYGIFALLLYLGLHYALASFLAICAGILFNFNTTGRIVFKNSNHRLLFQFLIVYSIIYLINVLLLKLMVMYAINLYLGSATTVLPMAFLAYLLNKKFVFNQKNEVNYSH
jgi:putative flippase GtrA